MELILVLVFFYSMKLPKERINEWIDRNNLRFDHKKIFNAIVQGFARESPGRVNTQNKKC